MNLVTIDSRVTVTCETEQQSGPLDRNSILRAVSYFGRIQEILELDYGHLKPIVLLCNWMSPIWRGPTACLQKDKYGFTLIKSSRLMRRSENSFVFPLQASQVFFSKCGEEPDWLVVLHANARSTRVHEQADINGSTLEFDMQERAFVEDIFGAEENHLQYGMVGTESLGEHITKEDLIAAHVAVEVEAQRIEEEGSKDDSLLEFLGDEDDVAGL